MRLTDWAELVRTELELAHADGMPRELAQEDITRILDVAREAAHAVTRPAAPVTTFLMGIAVARGDDPEQVATALRRLALTQAAPPTQDTHET